MITKYLLKTTEEYRLNSREEVENFHDELLKDAADQSYTLTSFSYVKKDVKVKGEIVESYFVVKAIKTFQSDKECYIPFTKIKYQAGLSMNEDVEDWG